LRKAISNLEARERCAEAQVHTAAEREGLDLRAPELDAVGIGVAIGIAVRGAEHDEDGLAGGDDDAAERDVDRREPAGEQQQRGEVVQLGVGEVVGLARFGARAGVGDDEPAEQVVVLVRPSLRDERVEVCGTLE
jgi:hypothetical protein